MKIFCQYHELLKVSDLLLKQWPNNPNIHSEHSIQRQATVMLLNGVRQPIVISNRSHTITKGHKRLKAAELNQWTEFPVQYQDYENEDREKADVAADNATSQESSLNLSVVNSWIADLDPTFDIEAFGIPNFALDVSDFAEPTLKKNPQDKDASLQTCPSCGVLIETNR